MSAIGPARAALTAMRRIFNHRRSGGLVTMFSVVIELRPPKAGGVTFACGINMLKVAIVVR